jgi:hypothetical protein
MTTEFIHFKLFTMPCCGHMLCWVNPRYPSYCPECGKHVYPDIKNPDYLLMSDENAKLVTK